MGDVNIQHVERLYLIEERGRGVSKEFLEDTGHVDVPAEIEVFETRAEVKETPSEYTSVLDGITEENIDATVRAAQLRNLAEHARPARQLEGLTTNHVRRPPKEKRAGYNRGLAEQTAMAQEALETACGACKWLGDCALAGNLDKWLNVHPYQNKVSSHGRELRPGTVLGTVEQAEYRDDFLLVLLEDPMAHCDPTKRSA